MSMNDHNLNRKFSPRDMAVNGLFPAIGAGAAVLALAGPLSLALGLAVVAGVSGYVLTNEIPKK